MDFALSSLFVKFVGLFSLLKDIYPPFRIKTATFDLFSVCIIALLNQIVHPHFCSEEKVSEIWHFSVRYSSVSQFPVHT